MTDRPLRAKHCRLSASPEVLRRRIFQHKQRLRINAELDAILPTLALSSHGEVFENTKERLREHPESLLSRAVPLISKRSRHSHPLFFHFSADGFRRVVAYFETRTLSYGSIDEYNLQLTDDLIVHLQLPVERKGLGYHESVALFYHSGPVYATTQLAD